MNREHVTAAFVGFALAIALGLGGLTRPEVIVGWVDFFGDWDPTVLLFMIGATASYHLIYRLARRRRSSCIPTARRVDARLILGSAIFGVGWALGGVCPGPALTSLGAGAAWTAYFVPAMLVGLWLGRAYSIRQSTEYSQSKAHRTESAGSSERPYALDSPSPKR